MGTPEFSVPALEELATHHELALAITRPDSVRARGRALLPTPVKARARALGIPVLETTRLDEGVVSRIQELAPDCIVVAAYGAIIPDSILSIPRFGVINIHASLLPAYRGAAPVQRAILGGDPCWRLDYGSGTCARCRKILFARIYSCRRERYGRAALRAVSCRGACPSSGACRN